MNLMNSMYLSIVHNVGIFMRGYVLASGIHDIGQMVFEMVFSMLGFNFIPVDTQSHGIMGTHRHCTEYLVHTPALFAFHCPVLLPQVRVRKAESDHCSEEQ